MGNLSLRLYILRIYHNCSGTKTVAIYQEWRINMPDAKKDDKIYGCKGTIEYQHKESGPMCITNEIESYNLFMENNIYIVSERITDGEEPTKRE